LQTSWINEQEILIFKAQAKTAAIAGYFEDFGAVNWALEFLCVIQL